MANATLSRRITNPDALAGKTLAGPPVIAGHDVVVLRFTAGRWAAVAMLWENGLTVPDWRCAVGAATRADLGLED